MIGLDHISKFILSNITLHIPPGTSVGVVGESGAGKTTLLKLACGLLEAEQGEVYFDGDIQKDFSRGNSHKIGVLFTDKPVLNGEETILDNFYILKQMYRLQEEEFTERYDYLSEKLGFDKWEKEKVKNLSLGQRRRAEIGAILLHNPKVLFLDEATNGLDECGKEAFSELLKDYTKKGGTVLLSSHDLVSISNLCDRIAILKKGELLYYGGESLLMKQFAPIDVMTLKLAGPYPDLEDLPLESYSIDENCLTIFYNTNHITSAEILRTLMAQTSLEEIKIRKPDLTDAILKTRSEKNE